MNITVQQMRITEDGLNRAILTRNVGTNRKNIVAEAKRHLAEKREIVAMLRRLIALMDAAKFATCGVEYGANQAAEYREHLADESFKLERLENTVAIYDEIFSEEQEGSQK